MKCQVLFSLKNNNYNNKKGLVLCYNFAGGFKGLICISVCGRSVTSHGCVVGLPEPKVPAAYPTER